jgi:hypothetical protein
VIQTLFSAHHRPSIASVAAVQALALGTTIFRSHHRIRRGSFQWDDWLAVAASIFDAVFFATIFVRIVQVGTTAEYSNGLEWVLITGFQRESRKANVSVVRRHWQRTCCKVFRLHGRFGRSIGIITVCMDWLTASLHPGHPV